MWYFSLGAISVMGFLIAIGITRNRVFGIRTWTAIWTAASLTFLAFIVYAFLDRGTLATELALGGAVGYVGSVSVHTLHHYVELNKNPHAKAAGPTAELRKLRRRVPILAALLVFHAWLWVRMALAGDVAFFVLLTVPVAVFSIRLVAYGRRYRAITASPTPT